MNIENALKIDGWMSEEDLLWLAEHAAKYQNIVEVGCWMGRSTRALADNTSGRVWAVDTWKGSDEDKHQEILKDKPWDWLYKQFCLNMEPYLGGRVRALPGTSVGTAARWWVAKYPLLDMIFIDASHDYESVKADILAWKPLVKQGGILCGHDAGSPPIMQATEELLPGVRHEGSMWVIDL